ncbi:ABC transporter-related protein [Sulfurimonas denitrificans DSM 1251]|uniref:ABC transporter-related protein n=1 Tax=Sulfurimonas denitrificans (strain ATCC 33889 / DSM 1251) TaxID=326298 RepID=Q30NW5_SULDN|nr:ABC transporter ATP-binding protein [Sulfurimonas denitrificans]ABB45316.1 ABC transporter-related protein [Sulfurimonas denitrificans DSM 1251]MDD3442115.1 ABC transporter ATP-binding protein [Sulfurimonas denitrificans]
MTLDEKEAVISLHKVVKSYGSAEATTYALRGVNLEIKRGEFVAIMGPSGSGKSTAMNIIGCLDTLSSGDYLFGGVDIQKLSLDQRTLLRRNYIGFIFQGFNLLGKTTAIENVELPLLYRGFPARQRSEMAMNALRSVGLEQVAHHTPAELSGGQQQRVAIARAIVTDPFILLADEPTGNLDTAKSREIMELLSSFNKEKGLTIVMVTHENEMASYASRIIRFRDGKIDDTLHVEKA